VDPRGLTQPEPLFICKKIFEIDHEILEFGKHLTETFFHPLGVLGQFFPRQNVPGQKVPEQKV
jgi:hypothetical protein